MNTQHTKLSASGTITSYTVGFILSVVLTLASFGLVQLHLNDNHETISHFALSVAIFVFAISQLAVQLVLFLHLGHEKKPYRQSLTFLFAAFIISILVIGSLWIMANLDYSHGGVHSTSETDAHIIRDEGISR
jgi:cytochrome o ubiquinol oxidase operon protein cyoD